MTGATAKRDSIHGRSGPLLFIGGITSDAIAAVGRYPRPDERVVADEIVMAGGGPAATAAVAAARLGAVDVRLIGAVGEDATAGRLIAELSAEGIDVSGVARVRGARTGASVVVVDTGAGTRAISARPGPSIPEVDAETLSGARWVHVDHLGWPAIRRTKRPGVRLSVDISYPVAGFELDGVELFVPSLESLRRRYGSREDVLAQARRAGARRTVATRGAGGCIGIDADGRRLEAAGEHVEVVSSLGAGDVFHGALLAAVDRGDPLDAAMSFANRVAAQSCRGLDGRSAIPYAHQATSEERYS